VAKEEFMAIMLGSKTGLSIEKFFESPFAGKHPKLINTSTEAAAAEAAVTAAEAIAVADLEEARRLAAEFETLGGSVFVMAIAQKAEHGDHLRECWLARERLCASDARSISLVKILTARTDVTAEAAEVAAAEAAVAEAAAAMEAAAAAEATAAAGAAAKAAADALGARKAFAA
jgi:hypothetical protein